ncbi:MAG TPA: hypothetical protein VHB48_02070 [Chitinophagaceae bacterium]|jgi:hypothetical protein|nr:hypothetical protein [Chitinophagaceae bacterium]
MYIAFIKRPLHHYYALNMDEFITLLYQNLYFLAAFAGVLIIAKFFAGLVFFKGNVVDSVSKFFRFYTSSNIGMTDSNAQKTMKRLNNLLNLLIYILVLVCATVYFIHPEVIE